MSKERKLDSSEIESPSSVPLWVGLGITVIYVTLIFGFFFADIIDLRNQKLNEVGDFLAGAFSPLAFLWLVVSLSLQRGELKQNTQALKLQLRELKQTVIHQGQLADAAKTELDKDKPLLKLIDLVLSASQPRNSKKLVYELNINMRNLAGLLHETKITLSAGSTNIFQIYHGDFDSSLKNKLHKFSKNELPNEIFSTSQVAILTVSGLDSSGKKYEKKYQLEMELQSVVRIETHDPHGLGFNNFPEVIVDWNELAVDLWAK